VEEVICYHKTKTI